MSYTENARAFLHAIAEPLPAMSLAEWAAAETAEQDRERYRETLARLSRVSLDCEIRDLELWVGIGRHENRSEYAWQLVEAHAERARRHE